MTKENNSSIIASVNHTFDIILESMLGSTNYGWSLKSMPDGVALLSTEIVPIRTGISPVRQIFTFAALEPVKDGIIEFAMLCMSNPSSLPADTATYHIYIHAEDENDALEKVIGSSKFLKGSGTVNHFKPIPLYGFPMESRTIMPYGFPKPADTAQVNVVHSKNNCLLKYGTPWGVTEVEADCNLKYGFPVNMPIYKYGFPMTNQAGEEFEVVHDDKNCIVKYGFPGGIGALDKHCTMLYGFPKKKE